MSEHHLVDLVHQELNDAISNNLYTGLAYGMFLAVYLISIRILLSKGPLLRSVEQMFLFGITAIIFILSTIVIVLGPGLMSQVIPTMIKTMDPTFDRVWSIHKLYVVSSMMTVITGLNPILSDVVCAWRAMVLWKYDRRVVTILSICLLGTFAACIYDFHLEFTQGVQPRHFADCALILTVPILVTNVLSTSLIAWKAWDYHQTVGAHFKKGRSFGRVEKVLVLLVESGFIYLIVWMFYLLSSFSILPGAGSYMVNTVMVFISSMYPVSINVLAVTTQSYESSEVYGYNQYSRY